MTKIEFPLSIGRYPLSERINLIAIFSLYPALSYLSIRLFVSLSLSLSWNILTASGISSSSPPSGIVSLTFPDPIDLYRIDPPNYRGMIWLG